MNISNTEFSLGKSENEESSKVNPYSEDRLSSLNGLMNSSNSNIMICLDEMRNNKDDVNFYSAKSQDCTELQLIDFSDQVNSQENINNTKFSQGKSANEESSKVNLISGKRISNLNGLMYSSNSDIKICSDGMRNNDDISFYSAKSRNWEDLLLIDFRNNVNSQENTRNNELSSDISENVESIVVNSSHEKENSSLVALMNSSNSVIKKCAEDIDEITKRNQLSGFDHKTTIFKRIDRDLFKLMVKLDNIDVESDYYVEEERKIALNLIQDLISVLENKVKCKLDDCIICETGIDLKNK
jgi:hypothetical protein